MYVYGDYGGGHMFMVTMEVDTYLWLTMEVDTFLW